MSRNQEPSAYNAIGQMQVMTKFYFILDLKYNMIIILFIYINLAHIYLTHFYIIKVIVYTIYTEITFNVFCDLFTHLFPLLVLYKYIFNIFSIYLLFYSRPLV